jgi:hypothetical protein
VSHQVAGRQAVFLESLQWHRAEDLPPCRREGIDVFPKHFAAYGADLQGDKDYTVGVTACFGTKFAIIRFVQQKNPYFCNLLASIGVIRKNSISNEK